MSGEYEVLFIRLELSGGLVGIKHRRVIWQINKEGEASQEKGLFLT